MSNPRFLLLCRFLAQQWIGDDAAPVERARRDATWYVVHSGPLPREFSHESDDLRCADTAPQWVKAWSGPYEVDYEVVGLVTPLPEASAEGEPEPTATAPHE